MTSVHILATMCSNNDHGSYNCNQDGGGTGVSKPDGQGIGEEAHGQNACNSKCGLSCHGGSPAVSKPSKGKAVDFESLGGRSPEAASAGG
jgi:hypothetical protein